MLIVELGVATQKNQVYNNTIICMGRRENNVNNDLNREVLQIQQRVGEAITEITLWGCSYGKNYIDPRNHL